jgi:WhiB family redox-sensing transcriptional regulator
MEHLEGSVALVYGETRTETENPLRWRIGAACKDTDPDLFFPIGATGSAIEQIDDAKAVCGSCSARVECLDFALETNQDSGVWGGLSEEERREIRRARRRLANT